MAKKNQFLIDGLLGFDGRFRRSEYWIASIGLAIVRMVVLLIGATILGMGFTEAGNSLPLRIGMDLFFMWPYAAITIKRGHDRNRSARYTCVLFGAMYALSWSAMALVLSGEVIVGGVVSLGLIALGLYFLIDYGFIDGTKGPNPYGLSPKGHAGSGADVAKAFD